MKRIVTRTLASGATPGEPAWLRPELIASWPTFIGSVIVLGGEPALASARAAWYGASSHYGEFFQSNLWLLRSVAWESALLAMALGYLHWRGWRRPDLRIRIGGWSSWQALVLWFAMKVGYALAVLGVALGAYFLQQVVFHGATAQAKGTPHLLHATAPNPLLMIFSCVLNAYYEEILAMGYIFNQLAAKRGPGLALGLVVALRMLCHTYQGVIHMAAAGAIFFVAGSYYWRTRNLWPLILAHALFDIVPLHLLKLL